VRDLADRLESHLAMAEKDLVMAMEQTPLHGLLAVLRYVPPSPLLHIADLPVILSGLSSWMSRRWSNGARCFIDY
jgi:hypothetical protein